MNKFKYLLIILIGFLATYITTLYGVIERGTLSSTLINKETVVYQGTPIKVEENGSCCFDITSTFNNIEYKQRYDKEDVMSLKLNQYSKIVKNEQIAGDNIFLLIIKLFILIFGTPTFITSAILLVTYLYLPEDKDVFHTLDFDLADNEAWIITTIVIPTSFFIISTIILLVIKL